MSDFMGQMQLMRCEECGGVHIRLVSDRGRTMTEFTIHDDDARRLALELLEALDDRAEKGEPGNLADAVPQGSC